MTCLKKINKLFFAKKLLPIANKMANCIKSWWHGESKNPNFGDALTPIIIQAITGTKPEKVNITDIEKYTIEIRDTKLGPELLTRDIPNVSEEALANLD